MLDALVWQVMDWMESYGIPLERVIRHADLNSCSRAGCPGDAIFLLLMARLQGEVVEPDPQPVVPSKPAKIPGFNGTKDVVYNCVVVHAELREVTASQEINVRKYADSCSALTPAPVQARQTFPVLG